MFQSWREPFLTNLFYGLAGATNETVVQVTVSLFRTLVNMGKF